MRAPDSRSPLLALALALLTLGLAACSQNVCQQAAQKLNECVSQRCAADQENPMCAGIENATANVGQCSEVYVYPGLPPVGGEARAQAERVVALSCEDIFAGAALVEGADTAIPTN